VTGPAPGVTDLKWLKPVYAGDSVAYTTEVTALRRSRSRPQWGLATLLTTGINQHGQAVISFFSLSFVPLRSGEGGDPVGDAGDDARPARSVSQDDPR